MNIYQRVNAVQKKVKYVQKDAVISGGGSYKAVTHDQVIAAIRSELVENGIVIYPELLKSNIEKEKTTKGGSIQYLYSADYAIHFVNMEKEGDRISVTVNAHAMDSGDKAPGKALTYATKSAILKVFSLETGENEESRTHSSEPYSEDQKEIFDDLLESGTPTEFLEFLSQLPEAGQIGLYNSGAKGEKVKLKEKAKKKQQEAHKVIDSYVDQIREGIANNDDMQSRELIEELTKFEKHLLAKKLDQNEIDYLAKLAETENE